MPDLADQVAIVTGGASGLGRATALVLAAAGAEVVVADLDEEAGRAVAEQVGGHFVATDVSDLEANRAMVAFALERCGGVDHAFLNAGVASMIGVGPEFDVERYRRIMGINLDGVVFGTHALLPALRRAHAEGGSGARAGGSPSIAATASLAGLTAVPYDPLYAANKHAVVGFARSMGLGLVAEGIRFNAVCPGFAESQIIAPIREALVESGLPIIPAERVAEAVLALFAGDMSGECWFVQAGREAAAFNFRGIPGPREEPAQ